MVDRVNIVPRDDAEEEEERHKGGGDHCREPKPGFGAEDESHGGIRRSGFEPYGSDELQIRVGRSRRRSLPRDEGVHAEIEAREVDHLIARVVYRKQKMEHG